MAAYKNKNKFCNSQIVLQFI